MTAAVTSVRASRPRLSPADRPAIAAVWGVALFGLVLAADANLPPGYAGAMGYVVPVLLGLWVRSTAYPLAVAVAASVAAVGVRLGAAPPAGVALWLVWLNRGTALVAIWASAAVVVAYR